MELILVRDYLQHTANRLDWSQISIHRWQNMCADASVLHLPPPPFLPSLFICSPYSSLPLLQCREIGFEIHEEVLKALHELHTAMKTHHAYQSEFRQAESKLQVRNY
jgi:hypothetical protein